MWALDRLVKYLIENYGRGELIRCLFAPLPLAGADSLKVALWALTCRPFAQGPHVAEGIGLTAP